eukprot:489189-Rhodomonas_salina.1
MVGILRTEKLPFEACIVAATIVTKSGCFKEQHLFAPPTTYNGQPGSATKTFVIRRFPRKD